MDKNGNTWIVKSGVNQTDPQTLQGDTLNPYQVGSEVDHILINEVAFKAADRKHTKLFCLFWILLKKENWESVQLKAEASLSIKHNNELEDCINFIALNSFFSLYDHKTIECNANEKNASFLSTLSSINKLHKLIQY